MVDVIWCCDCINLLFNCNSSEVLLVSGLEIGGSSSNEMALTLLSDYISGGLDSAEDASKICRLIIAGDSITHEAHDKEQHYKVLLFSKNFHNLLMIVNPSIDTA